MPHHQIIEPLLPPYSWLVKRKGLPLEVTLQKRPNMTDRIDIMVNTSRGLFQAVISHMMSKSVACKNLWRSKDKNKKKQGEFWYSINWSSIQERSFTLIWLGDSMELIHLSKLPTSYKMIELTQIFALLKLHMKLIILHCSGILSGYGMDIQLAY